MSVLYPQVLPPPPQTLFAHGNVLEFKSKASGKSLRIVNEEVDGLGEEDEEQGRQAAEHYQQYLYNVFVVL